MDRKSTSGVVFNMGSSAITWMSKKQDIVALCSLEVEYIALCVTCCQDVLLKQVLEDCGLKYAGSIRINYDNKSCIAIAQNPILHGRTNHVAVKFHYIKDLVAENTISLHYCTSKNQIANIMTKCLDGKKFLKFWEMLVFVSFNQGGDCWRQIQEKRR